MMLINRLYYGVKPMVPAWLRLAARRARAKQLRKACHPVWPIYEPSGRPPQGWPGWPEGKSFAFVLTHDVEGLAGLNRCRQLAELELECGFRSSFNFIPNGEYEVPRDLLEWLRKSGFEIGVHDLFHDGNLFRSRDAFQGHAQSINAQLAVWGAVGFRAGFMLHQLDWLHSLNIEYDSSTFDVDPFEPQADGVQTVFPFWCQRPDPEDDAYPASDSMANQSMRATGAGYVELPYTLSQDHTLFVILRERGIRIWRQKLKWLVDKGAMALLNSHPDYMAMPGEPVGRGEFSCAHYREFLEHVRSAYAGRYWHALPREVAACCRPIQPRQARPPRQIVMLSHSFYLHDNRVRRYAETLAKRGDEVRVFSLGSEEQVKAGRWVNVHGVKLFHVQSRATAESGKWDHARRLIQFLMRACRALNDQNLPHGCDLLHVHNIPDFLVFAGVRLKHRGAKVILDIHDIVPELYESKFNSGQNSALLTLLRRIEAWSCRFSHHVIIANHIWKRTILGRSASAEKVTALVNNVDLELFAPREAARNNGGPILLYPGSLNHHQGLDLVIKTLPDLVGEFPGIQFHVYGRGPALPELKTLSARLGLDDRVRFLPSVQLDEVAGLMAGADIGIVPKRAEGFGDQAYSTKIMEMMSQKLPVIVSRTSVDSFYFNDSVVAFFESGNTKDLADKISRLARDPEYRRTLAANGYAYAQANSWEKMKHTYLDLVDRLTATSFNYPLVLGPRSPAPE